MVSVYISLALGIPMLAAIICLALVLRHRRWALEHDKSVDGMPELVGATLNPFRRSLPVNLRPSGSSGALELANSPARKVDSG